MVVKVHDNCQNLTWNGHSCQKLENFEKKDQIESIKDLVSRNYSNIKSINIENYNSWIDSLNSDIKNIAYNENYSKLTVNSYAQLYKIYDSVLMKYEYEFRNNLKYDIVIRLRPDNLFILDLEFDNFISSQIKLLLKILTRSSPE
jgi:hypothetical protein